MVDLVVFSNPEHPLVLLNAYNAVGEALEGGNREAIVTAFESACTAVRQCLADTRKEHGRQAEKQTRVEAGVILMMGSLQFRANTLLHPDDRLLHAAAERCEKLVEKTFAQSRLFGL